MLLIRPSSLHLPFFCAHLRFFASSVVSWAPVVPVTRTDAGDYVRHYFRPELAIPGTKPSMNILDLGPIHGENLHEAYTFQDYTISELEATGDKLLGWRVQGNSATTRRKLHYRELYGGPLMRSMVRNYTPKSEQDTKEDSAEGQKVETKSNIPPSEVNGIQTDEMVKVSSSSPSPSTETESETLSPIQKLEKDSHKSSNRPSRMTPTFLRPSISKHNLLDVEIHLAFEIYSPIIPSIITSGEVAEYLTNMYCVLELTACRLPLRPTTVAAHVADMAGGGYTFFGDPISSEKWSVLDLSDIKAVLLHNNIPIVVCNSSSLVGTVMSAVKFISRHLKTRARPLQKDQVVLCGSFGCAQVKPGHLTAHFGPLGTVEALIDS